MSNSNDGFSRNLPKLIDDQRIIASLSNATTQRHYFGHDLWLIFALGSSFNSLDSIANALKKSYVRFDSGFFGFIKSTKGSMLLKTFSMFHD